MARRYAVSLSKNPGLFVKEDGAEQGIIVTGIDEVDAPKTNMFLMACSELELGSPRVGEVLPYLTPFEPNGWRSVKIGRYQFWTNCEPGQFE